MLAYTETGKGPRTILFLHGLGSNRKAFQRNLEGLKDHFRCISVDLPNYGDSPKGDFPFSMAFFAEEVYRFIRENKLRPLALAGHSMGAQVALYLAHRYPEALEWLILLAPAGFETFTPAEGKIVESWYTPEILRAITPEQLRFNVALNFYRFPPEAEYMIQDRLQLMNSPDFEGYVQMIPRCVRAMLQEPVFDLLPAIPHRTLVIYGLQDALIPNRVIHPLLSVEAVANQGYQKLRRAELMLLHECGHFPQWEAADTVNHAIRKFVP